MALYKYGGPSDDKSKPVGITEFEILKASHKFLRDDDEKASSWDEQLAAKYYTSLYREFAVCDLKHYKSGNFALRWRTEEEVLSGSGETTCGNTRCQHHFAPRFQDEDSKPSLTTLELPFSYVEQGENKSALVKVALCGKCVKKLMWKRQKEKEKAATELDLQTPTTGNREVTGAGDVVDVDKEDPLAKRRKKGSRDGIPEVCRRRSSRSRSPRRPRTSDISRRPPSIPRRR
ncbi:hypothetical protein BYT27DRAFT_7196697 [Phlegmacium glaucopus]|nr:hypothetical protein BYT27DRAFT_7196697 [Phlegmacium glaucopus]